MKVLSGLNFENFVDDNRAGVTAPVGVMLDEPVPGWFRQVRLTSAGLVVERGEERVLFPLADVLDLAEAACEGLRPERGAAGAEVARDAGAAGAGLTREERQAAVTALAEQVRGERTERVARLVEPVPTVWAKGGVV